MSFKTSLKWGWVRDEHDSRDHVFTPKLTREQVSPVSDLRNFCPMIVDQGSLGSCVGNGVAAILQIAQLQQGKVYYEPSLHGKPVTDFTFAPSRLFIYYGAREMEGTVNEDDGCQIRDAIKFVAANGACSSSKWPYHIGKFTDKPTPACYTEAVTRGKVKAYHRLDNNDLHTLLSCLSQGQAFVCGIQVYDSFMSELVASTGVVPMPNKHEQLQGGHCIAIVGHSIAKRSFIGRNSWGPEWGLKGYFLIPFDYLTHRKLANDFWTITQVE
jgi:C1A family cysteine protease